MRDQRRSSDVAEEWRDVVGYEGLYQVSNLGRVKSLPRKRSPKELILKQKTHNGYRLVGLSKNGFVRTARVNRLVAEAFIPNPKNHPIVNHLDGRKENNTLENLEWCTYRRNLQHAHSLGLNSPDAWLKAGSEARKIKVVRSDGAVFDSIADAANATGAHHGNISKVLKGQLGKTAGYSFSYYKEEVI